jgi:hypothetical protein
MLPLRKPAATMAEESHAAQTAEGLTGVSARGNSYWPCPSTGVASRRCELVRVNGNDRNIALSQSEGAQQGGDLSYSFFHVARHPDGDDFTPETIERNCRNGRERECPASTSGFPVKRERVATCALSHRPVKIRGGDLR